MIRIEAKWIIFFKNVSYSRQRLAINLYIRWNTMRNLKKKKKINWSVVNRYFNCDSIPVFDFRRINRFKKNIRERSIEMYPKLTANMEGGGGKNKWIKYRNFSYDRYCDASFLECLRYLEGVIEQTALKRQDDTITAINEQKWVVPDNMQQIQSVQKECLNAMERDKKVMPPFEGPIGK